MSLIRIRFNKARGNPGRGTVDHVWRVFEDGKEYLVKNFKINAPTFSAKEENSDDWNLCCNGVLSFDRTTSTAIVKEIK